VRTTDIVLRILLAFALGGAVGLERQLRDQAAGFRTHILVSLGAATFAMASVFGFESFITVTAASNVRVDPAGIAGGVVTGIGFLGAGAIIRHGISVRGLTTAASLWAVAAVGLASGLGLYVLAAISAAATLLGLFVLHFFEARVLDRRLRGLAYLEVRFAHRAPAPLNGLLESLDQHQVVVKRLTMESEDTEGALVHLKLQLPSGMRPSDVVRVVDALEGVEAVSLN
jgi:putative Mg2+ transporter-C (MgtC) family protein